MVDLEGGKGRDLPLHKTYTNSGTHFNASIGYSLILHSTVNFSTLKNHSKILLFKGAAL